MTYSNETEEIIEAIADGRCDFKPLRDRVRTLERELAEAQRIVRDLRFDLQDPVKVHANMLRGIIGRITLDQCAHVHGEEAVQELHTMRAASEYAERMSATIMTEIRRAVVEMPDGAGVVCTCCGQASESIAAIAHSSDCITVVLAAALAASPKDQGSGPSPEFVEAKRKAVSDISGFVKIVRDEPACDSGERSAWTPVSAPLVVSLNINGWHPEGGAVVHAFARTQDGDKGQCYEMRLPPLPVFASGERKQP